MTLIVRVTGEENGQMRLEEIERQGYSCNAWTTRASGLAITRLQLSRQRCQWELAAELPEIHRARKAGWEMALPSEAIHQCWRR